MEEPVIAGRKPVSVTLEAGTKYWCACGRSSNQPWCGGSHKDTSFKPVEMTVEEPKEARMCMCKRTKNPGYCDGSHARLPEE